MAVPKIVINDAVEFEGALPERDFLRRGPPGREHVRGRARARG